MYSDSHMHTAFSVDSQAEPAEMAEAAWRKGLPSVCFTDHMDKDYFEEGREFVIDTPAYFAVTGKLKEDFQGRMEIRTGIELGLQPHLADFYRDYVQKWPFDYIIGSIHVIGGKDPYYDDFFEGISDREAYRMAFEETWENIRLFQDFHALGHMDYVVRYGKRQAEDYDPAQYGDLISEILKELIYRGKGLELNTGGLKYGLPFAHPHPWILKRYRELGGEIVTLGADAHKPEHIAWEFGRAREILESCGFRYYAEFTAGKPEFRKIAGNEA